MLARLRIANRPRHLWLRRCSSIPPLPPPDTWKQEFPVQGVSSRAFVRNSTLADKLAEGFFKDTPDNDGSDEEGKIVIEAFPGPGVLTRSLMKLPPSKVKKIIVLEDVPHFLKCLTPLEEVDPRVVVVPLSGYSWATYNELDARGLFDDIVKKEWEEEEPNLHFIGQLPNSVSGEQILSQFFRLIPERAWLFKYGRVPMSLLMAESPYKRITYEAGDMAHCKLSVIAKAVASVEEVLPFEKLQPYGDNFYPPTYASSDRNRGSRSIGSPVAAVNIIPFADPLIARGMLDKWDYILRRLFVLRTTPLRKAITSLGPGAANLLPIIGSPSLPKEQRVDIQKKIRDLDMKEWALIAKAFDEWPFAPEDLQISDSIYKDIERNK